ncbi:MAG TPA: lysyl oxidase family protein [Kofleriaceae bacterium]
MRLRLGLLAGSALALASACATNDRGSAGALVRVDMSSHVAVLLDDVPVGPLREAAAANALAQPPSFWTERAAHQVRLMYYRLVFRSSYYASDPSTNPHTRGPLPLPPREVWNVALTGVPHRVTESEHDEIVADYAFQTYLVTDKASPGAVEPNLAAVGGTWDEPFRLPDDPDLLLERTGYACMDEFEYPPGSVFEENTWYFYDDACKAGPGACHVTVAPRESCVEALQKHTGLLEAALHFTRISYDAAIADAHRVGTVVNPAGADLSVVQAGMRDEHRFVYRYFAPGSCDLAEGVIGDLGWRRLLMFSAIVQNNGTAAIHIGDVTDPTNPWVTSHVFEFSPCHRHYHFSHYGNFDYGGAPGAKRAFCLEDTNRFHNDEATPLTAVHQSCESQGIGAGWGDEYEFGIPGQWVDVTGVDTTAPHDLVFDNNPDAFLCEGTPVLDAHGQLVFDPTSFTNATGDVVSRLRCAMPSTWHGDNIGSIAVSSPGGSYVTEPCKLEQIGPNRDCGFTAQDVPRTCTPGQPVTLACTNQGAAQALRVCERSAALGVGVACAFADAPTTAIVDGPTQVAFPCPTVRDQAGAGGYAVYTASVVPSQGTGSVTCTGL